MRSRSRYTLRVVSRRSPAGEDFGKSRSSSGVEAPRAPRLGSRSSGYSRRCGFSREGRKYRKSSKSKESNPRDMEAGSKRDLRAAFRLRLPVRGMSRTRGPSSNGRDSSGMPQNPEGENLNNTACPRNLASLVRVWPGELRDGFMVASQGAHPIRLVEARRLPKVS